MVKKYLRFATLTLVLFIFINMIGACTKNENTAIQNSSGITKSAEPSKTSAKTAAVTSSTSKPASATEKDTSGSSQSGTGIILSKDEDISETKNDIIENADVHSDSNGDTGETSGEGFVAGDIDFGGRTIVLAAWGENLIPRDYNDPIAELLLKYNKIKEAEKKYNFKMEYRVIPNFDQYNKAFLQETLAGMVFADILRVGSAVCYPSLVKNNMILPLDEYIDYKSPIVQANQYMVKSAYWMGRYYGITSERENAISKVIWNKDILDREGQPDIIDLIEKDQWNWNTFLDIAVNCTKDINGDGIIDQWGVTTVKTSTISTLPFYFLAANNVTIVDFNENDRPYFTLTSPAAQRALQFASDLNFVHKVYTESGGGQDTATVYMNGNAAMYLNNPTYNVKFLASGMQSLIAPLPKGPDTNQYVNISSVNFEVLPVNCKDPRNVARVYFETCIQWDENGNRSPEYDKIITDALGYDWDWSPANSKRRWSTEREFLYVIKPLWEVKTPDFSGGFGTDFTNLIVKELFTPIMAGTKSVSQGVSQIKDGAQAIIDEAVN